MTEEEALSYVQRSVSGEAFERLQRYVDLLLEENGQQNLISRGSAENIWCRHIADSVQLNQYANSEGAILDMGSGPGLPGVVLAVMIPDRVVHLVESRKIRANWLTNMASELGIGNAVIHCERIEHVAGFKVGTITARAFAPLLRLIELAKKFATEDTVWVLPKGGSAQQELETVDHSVGSLFHVEHSVTSDCAGILVGKGSMADV